MHTNKLLLVIGNFSGMDVWTLHFGLIDDCLRSCVFCDYISRQNPPVESAWPAIADMCYSDAVMSWTQVFGQNSQETHWRKLVERLPIPPAENLKPFSQEMILSYLKISSNEWKAFHRSMLEMRNTRLAHMNISCGLDEYPNITYALQSAYIYREWLTESLLLGNRLGYKINVSEDRAEDAVLRYRNLIAKAYHNDQ